MITCGSRGRQEGNNMLLFTPAASSGSTDTRHKRVPAVLAHCVFSLHTKSLLSTFSLPCFCSQCFGLDMRVWFVSVFWVNKSLFFLHLSQCLLLQLLWLIGRVQCNRIGLIFTEEVQYCTLHYTQSSPMCSFLEESWHWGYSAGWWYEMFTYHNMIILLTSSPIQCDLSLEHFTLVS